MSRRISNEADTWRRAGSPRHKCSGPPAVAFHSRLRSPSTVTSSVLKTNASAEMDKRLEEFQQLLAEVSAKGAGGTVNLLLRQMGADEARCLRLCAIPHEFDLSIFRTLAPELDEEKARAFYDSF